MQHPALMGIVNRVRQHRHERAGASWLETTLRQRMPQGLALDQFHAQKMLAPNFSNLVDRHDVRMLQPRGGFRLELEPPHPLLRIELIRQHQLQRDMPLQRALPRSKHHPHPAPRQLALQLIITQRVELDAHGAGPTMRHGPEIGDRRSTSIHLRLHAKLEQTTSAEASRGAAGQHDTALGTSA